MDLHPELLLAIVVGVQPAIERFPIAKATNPCGYDHYGYAFARLEVGQRILDLSLQSRNRSATLRVANSSRRSPEAG